MALLDDIFGKKEGPPPMQAQMGGGVPTEQVLTMKQQGFTNNQIVQNLQRSGFTIDQINEAVHQADMKEAVIPAAIPPSMPSPPPVGGFQPMPSTIMTGTQEEKIEEVAETIIDEKWKELMQNVSRIADWKDNTETRLTRMEQQMTDLKNSFDNLHEGILGKIGEYDKGLTNVATEIKALEKVFQKILPGFIDNVNELSRITKRIKK